MFEKGFITVYFFREESATPELLYANAQFVKVWLERKCTVCSLEIFFYQESASVNLWSTAFTGIR